MGLLGKLVLKLAADSAKFETDMKRARESAKKFGAQTKKAAGSAAKSMELARKSAKKFGAQTKKAAGSAAKSMAVAGTAALAMGAMIVKSNLASIDSLAKTADKLGATTEALAGLRHAAELTGVKTGTLDMAIQRMTRRLSEAAKGTGEAQGAIKELGLSSQELAKLKPEQQFAAIAAKMGEVTSQADKVRLSFKLFDSEGVALVNTLALGEDGLAAAAKEAEVLGLALSRVDAAKVEAANDAITRMSAGASGFGKTLTVALAPFIGAVADELTKAAIASNGFRDQIATGLDMATTGVIMLGKTFLGLNLVWDAVKLGFNVMALHVQKWYQLIMRGAQATLEFANVGGIFDGAVAGGQAMLANQAAVVSMLETDRDKILASGAATLTQYDELEGKVLSYRDSIEAASQAAAEAVAAEAPGGTNAEQGVSETGISEAETAKFASKLEALNNYLSAESERIDNASIARASMVIAAHEANAISDTKQAELLESIAIDHETKMTEIKQRALADRSKYLVMSDKEMVKSSVKSGLTLLTVAGRYNKKAEKVARAAAIVDAGISMWQGVAAGVKLGYPAAIPAVAAALATGAMALSNLGAGGTTSAPSGSTVEVTDPLGGQDTTERELTIKLVGMARDAFIEEEIIPGLNDAGERKVKVDYMAA